MKKNKDGITLKKIHWQNNQSFFTPEMKQEITRIIASGAVKPLVVFVDEWFSKKSEREYMLRQYVFLARNVFDLFLRLRMARNIQMCLLKKIDVNLQKLNRMEAQDPNVQNALDLLRIKKHIAVKRSNFSKTGPKDYAEYALNFFLQECFRFLKVAPRGNLIANLLVLFGMSSAVCGEEDGKKQPYHYYPAGYENGKIKIETRRTSKNKKGVHGKCSELRQSVDDAGNVKLVCRCQEDCLREIENVRQRASRAARLFSGELKEKEFKEYLAARLISASEGRTVSNGKKCALARPKLETVIRGEYLMPKFLKLTMGLQGRTDIYRDELAAILREYKISGIRALEFRQALNQDRKFLDAFKVNLWPSVSNKT